MIWTKAQVAAHQRALATAEKWAEPIDRLLTLAREAPQFKERIESLAITRENLERLARTAIAIDSQGG